MRERKREMLVKLENPEKAEALFGGWPETIIWSCLQGVMGAVYGDDLENPQSAAAILGDFCFFAGRPDKEWLLNTSGCVKPEFMIMVPQNDEWAELIVDNYGSRAKAVTRYATKKEGNVFDRDKLQAAISSLKPEYELKLIDRECFDLCREREWSRDLVSQFREYEMYKRLGTGAAVFKAGELVSGASSYAVCRDGIEIEIDTREEYRRQGLACACGAKLILECLERGLYPSWDAQNKGSVALAEKLGYHFDYEYTAYEIWGKIIATGGNK